MQRDIWTDDPQGPAVSIIPTRGNVDLGSPESGFHDLWLQHTSRITGVNSVISVGDYLNSDNTQLREIPVSSRVRLPYYSGALLSGNAPTAQTDLQRYTLQCDVKSLAVEYANVCPNTLATHEAITDGTNSLGTVTVKCSLYVPVTPLLTITSANTTTITVANAGWYVNQWQLPTVSDFSVVLFTGLGAVFAKGIASNTATVLTMNNGAFGVAPLAGDTFYICRRVRMCFGAGRTASLDPGCRARTDYHIGNVVKGTPIFLRHYVTTTGRWVQNPGSEVILDSLQAGSDRTDDAGNMGVSHTNTSLTNCGMNIGLWGAPAAPITTYGIMGTSISSGSGDVAGVEARGYFNKALINKAPYLNMAVAGESIVFARVNSNLRSYYLGDANILLLEYGRNDLGTGPTLSRTAAQVLADLVAYATPFVANGITCVCVTCTPNTTSTDGWITTTNQAIVGGTLAGTPEAERRILNAALRLVPAPFSACFDLTSYVESGFESGLWIPLYTTDGVHPDPTGHTVAAAGLTTFLGI